MAMTIPGDFYEESCYKRLIWEELCVDAGDD